MINECNTYCRLRKRRLSGWSIVTLWNTCRPKLGRFRTSATAIVLHQMDSGLDRLMDPLPPPCPVFLALFCSIGSNCTAQWLHIMTEQSHCFVNLQYRLFVMLTLILSYLKNTSCFLEACESCMWYKKCSGGKQRAVRNPEGGSKKGSYQWERGRVMFILYIFTYSEHFFKKFCASIYHAMFLGAGRYQKCVVMKR